MFGLLYAPVYFVFDLESIPIIKGTSNRGGCMHDLACRNDFYFTDKAGVRRLFTKQEAASLYLEAMACVDAMKLEEAKKNGTKWVQLKRLDRWWRRNVKVLAVRVAPNYWHKFPVFATYEELTA
jgi:hypothetical protein